MRTQGTIAKGKSSVNLWELEWTSLNRAVSWWEMLLHRCAGVVEVSLHGEKASPVPGCDEHPFIDLKSQFNPVRVSVRYFPIDPFWAAFCHWSIQKCLIEVYNSSQAKYFCWIQEANISLKCLSKTVCRLPLHYNWSQIWMSHAFTTGAIGNLLTCL